MPRPYAMNILEQPVEALQVPEASLHCENDPLTPTVSWSSPSS